MSGPRTKRSLSPFRLASGEILLARDVLGLGLSLGDDERGTVWRLLQLMDGSRDLEALTRELRKVAPELQEAAVQRAIVGLGLLGLLEDPTDEHVKAFSEAELDRYSRNLDFFSLVTLGSPRSALSLQRRLKQARVTILGVGAVGSATAVSLAAAGVGHLRLIDPELVETSNLNRQVLFTSDDVGRPKVEAAADRLRALNPHVCITTDLGKVERPEDVPHWLDGCDLFILGADRPHEILLWTNDAAVRKGTPWLENSYSGPRCALALFVPGKTPCLRCLQHGLETDQLREGTFVGSNLDSELTANAVIAPTAGIAGHYGALRALYFLADLRREDDGCLIQLNLWKPDDIRVVRPTFWPECPACGSGTRAAPQSTPARRRPGQPAPRGPGRRKRTG